MKVAFRKGNQIKFKEMERLEPQENQIRLKVDVCGICGTDIHDSSGEEQKFGHEIAGEIIALGPGVTHLKVGQKIVLDSATPCGRCGNCKNGLQELCTDIQSFYYLDQFGFAEEMNAPAISAIPYTSLEPAVACLQEPLGVAIDLVRLGDITTDSNVLVVGQGPIGLMATAIARMQGAKRVYVTDFASKVTRKKVAESLNIDGFIDAEKEDLSQFFADKPIDRVLVTAPPPALVDAINYSDKGAIISFIGIGHGDSARIEFDANEFHFKKLQLRASFASPAMFGPLALSYLMEGRVPGKELISHTFKLSDLEEAMAVAQGDPLALKVIVSNEG